MRIVLRSLILGILLLMQPVIYHAQGLPMGDSLDLLSTVEHTTSISGISWSPDGSQLSYVDENISQSIEIIAAPNISLSISDFTLINADTNLPIQTLNEGDVFDLSQMPTSNLTIHAKTTPSTVGSVVFDINGALQTDDTAPYEFTNWTPAPGQYTIAATPYSESGGTGTAGTPLTIDFTVEDSSSP